MNILLNSDQLSFLKYLYKHKDRTKDKQEFITVQELEKNGIAIQLDNCICLRQLSLIEFSGLNHTSYTFRITPQGQSAYEDYEKEETARVKKELDDKWLRKLSLGTIILNIVSFVTNLAVAIINLFVK